MDSSGILPKPFVKVMLVSDRKKVLCLSGRFQETVTLKEKKKKEKKKINLFPLYFPEFLSLCLQVYKFSVDLKLSCLTWRELQSLLEFLRKW